MEQLLLPFDPPLNLVPKRTMAEQLSLAYSVEVVIDNQALLLGVLQRLHRGAKSGAATS